MSEIGLDVLETSLDTKSGAISAQLGDAVSADAFSDGAEWIQHVGFASRPATAEPGKPACQVLTIETTGRDVCYASRDLRGTTLYGALGEGETCLYANGPKNAGTGLLTLKDDGSTATITIGVKQGNTSNGAPVKITVASDGKLELTTGAITMTLDGQTGAVTIDATSVSLGGLGGAPVVTDTGALQAWITTVGAALNALGAVNTPPVGIVSTKVTAA